MAKLFITGAGGYIGSTLVEEALKAGHTVVAYDRFFFGQDVLCDFKSSPQLSIVKADIRELKPVDLEGIEAVIDLAALSNDPAGELNPALTKDINYRGRVRVAETAKMAGVPRYMMASSCSVYGFSEQEMLDEEAPLNPQTEYARSMRDAETTARAMTNDNFSVTALRFATLFGLSRRMRFDLVVNTMTRSAIETGRIIVTGGGQQWRPLVHVRDVAKAFLAVFEKPQRVVAGEAFNLGHSNFRVQQLALTVRDSLPVPVSIETVPGSADNRSYSVSFEKAKRVLGYVPQTDVAVGVREIFAAMQRGAIDLSGRTVTVSWYKHLLEAEQLVDELRLNGRML